jgi:hypothetical protein
VRQVRVSWIIGGGRNPLRRPVDRLEAAVLVILAGVFVVTAPLLAVFAIRLADSAGLLQQRAERTLHQVEATLLGRSSTEMTGPFGPYGDTGLTVVTASWTAPAGRTRTGLIVTGPDEHAGQRVLIWVTEAGQLAEPPLSRTDVDERMAYAALCAELGLAAAMCVIVACVRLAADRYRMAGWARALAAMHDGQSPGQAAAR